MLKEEGERGGEEGGEWVKWRGRMARSQDLKEGAALGPALGRRQVVAVLWTASYPQLARQDGGEGMTGLRQDLPALGSPWGRDRTAQTVQNLGNTLAQMGLLSHNPVSTLHLPLKPAKLDKQGALRERSPADQV